MLSAATFRDTYRRNSELQLVCVFFLSILSFTDNAAFVCRACGEWNPSEQHPDQPAPTPFQTPAQTPLRQVRPEPHVEARDEPNEAREDSSSSSSDAPAEVASEPPAEAQQSE